MIRKPKILRPHESVGFLHRSGDAAWIVLSHWIACALYPEAWNAQHTLVAALAVVTFHFAGETNGLYRSWRAVPLNRELLKVWTTWTVVIPVLLFLAFISKTSEDHSRFIMLSWFGLAPVSLSVWRTIVRLGLQELRARDRNTRSVAIVGATPLGLQIASRINQERWTGLRVRGIYDDRSPSRREAIPADFDASGGHLDDLVERARRREIDTIYIALPLRAEKRINALIRKLADTTASVYMAADFFAFDLLRAEWTIFGDVPMVSVVETPFQGVDGWLKRVEDIVLGSVFLAFAAIPMAIVALAVKLTSPGPIFFRQRRYGLNGEVIEVLKFRTMAVCEDGPNVKQATQNDPRVTKIGALLRRTSLDELPQLFHVVSGAMSLVGPRPHAVAHNELYRSKIHGYMLRHKVKPGITGWAQVNGWRGETDTLDKMEKRIEHDLDYIRRWSLALDIKIIFMTVLGQLVGSSVNRNAY